MESKYDWQQASFSLKKSSKKKKSPDSAVKTELGCSLLQPKPTLLGVGDGAAEEG